MHAFGIACMHAAMYCIHMATKQSITKINTARTTTIRATVAAKMHVEELHQKTGRTKTHIASAAILDYVTRQLDSITNTEE